MGLFRNGSTGPSPYPTEGYPPDQQYPYQPDQQYPYQPSAPSLPRTDSAFHRMRDYRPPTGEPGPILQKGPGKDTEYIGMLLDMSQNIERRPYWNILAATCTWTLLAGFIVLPGTYTKFENSEIVEAAKADTSNVKNKILASIANMGLLIVAAVLCGIGVLGITGLWLKWRANYIWLINKVLLPALLNSFMGLISTLVNVLSKPDKTFSLTAQVTTGVTGGLSLIWTLMFLYYNNFLLARVKARHIEAYGEDAKDMIANNNVPPVVV